MQAKHFCSFVRDAEHFDVVEREFRRRGTAQRRTVVLTAVGGFVPERPAAAHLKWLICAAAPDEEVACELRAPGGVAPNRHLESFGGELT